MDHVAAPVTPAPTPTRPPVRPGQGLLMGSGVWLLAGFALLQLDGRLELPSLALGLVLAAALAGLWLPAALAPAACLAAVAWFNWTFVPPRGSWHVAGQGDAVLLACVMGVSLLISALMGALRRRAAEARAAARRAERLQTWGERLRDSSDPLTLAGQLQQWLGEASGRPVHLLLLRGPLPALDLAPGSEAAAGVVSLLRAPGEGEGPEPEQLAGLWHCLRRAEALGPGTGRHAEQPHLYLPLRGLLAPPGAATSQTGARGACVVMQAQPTSAGMPLLRGESEVARVLRAHLQALCDAYGLALARAEAQRQAAQARGAAEQQALRATLLAAVSHDTRTPLATILGSASALLEQDDRLSPAARRELAGRIADEARRLTRLTENTLQLARLDRMDRMDRPEDDDEPGADAAPAVQLACDWQSAEELVGIALRHARRQTGGERVRARLEPDLPLLWCDALLLTQLLDNLIDNALAYSPPDAPVELLVSRQRPRPVVTAAAAASGAVAGDSVVIAVRDRGPGIAPAWRAHIFEVFQRGAAGMAGRPAPRERAAGTGVGLAVCRAIARAHGGELRLRARGHGGSAFECVLPVRSQPEAPALLSSATAP